MADYGSGDVVLVDVPFTDLSAIKKRPAVVLLSRGDDYLVAFLTSRVERASQDDVFVAASAENGLAVESAVLVTKLFTIHDSLIVRRLGRLANSNYRDIVDRLTRLLRSTVEQ